jgi:uncharacterized damage-inducible protein DinB
MTGPDPSISFRELFAYSDHLANRWIAYFKQHPAALDVDVGGQTGTLRTLVGHIFDVENFFAALLLEEGPARPVRDNNASRSLDDLLRAHQQANGKLLRYLSSVSNEELQRKHGFGPVTASSRKILAQAAMHSVHHWAQVAMEVRQAGFPVEKPQDIIITDVME